MIIDSAECLPRTSALCAEYSQRSGNEYTAESANIRTEITVQSWLNAKPMRMMQIRRVHSELSVKRVSCIANTHCSLLNLNDDHLNPVTSALRGESQFVRRPSSAHLRKGRDSDCVLVSALQRAQRVLALSFRQSN